MVTGKLNLAQLYERVGYAKTLLSRGRFAEFLAADNRCAAVLAAGMHGLRAFVPLPVQSCSRALVRAHLVRTAVTAG